jgi:hypothetical protein
MCRIANAPTVSKLDTFEYITYILLFLISKSICVKLKILKQSIPFRLIVDRIQNVCDFVPTD